MCRHRTYNSKCSTCRSRKCRAADPVKYAYLALRNNAKRRRIPFTITLEDFRLWCYKVQYIGFKGRRSESATVDRIHDDIGYHIDNIQKITNRDNVRKRHFGYDWRSRRVYEIKEPAGVADAEDMPFLINQKKTS